MYRIDQLEDALSSAISATGTVVRPYNLGEDPKDLAREAAERPVALVAFQRCVPAAEATFARRRGLEFGFHLLVAARNLRASSALPAARGDAASPGIYQTLDALRNALSESVLGLTIQPLAFVAEEAVVRRANLSVYRQEWKITVYE